MGPPTAATLSIIVPCHRVIGQQRRPLTGYGGGIPIKRWLLALEQQTADNFTLTPDHQAAFPIWLR